MSTEPTRAVRIASAQVWLLGKCSLCGTPLVREEQGLFGQRWQNAMGIDWTTERSEIAEAIPPAYTTFIGAQLINHLTATTLESS